MYARTADAVPSGRRLTERPSRSSKMYICFSTTSVTSPTERTNSNVYSSTGVRSSRYANASSTSRARCSRNCHFDTSGGRMSFMPLTLGGTSAMERGFYHRGTAPARLTSLRSYDGVTEARAQGGQGPVDGAGVPAVEGDLDLVLRHPEVRVRPDLDARENGDHLVQRTGD